MSTRYEPVLPCVRFPPDSPSMQSSSVRLSTCRVSPHTQWRADTVLRNENTTTLCSFAEKCPAGQGTVRVKGSDECLTNLRVNQSYVEEKTKANIEIIVQNVVKIHPRSSVTYCCGSRDVNEHIIHSNYYYMNRLCAPSRYQQQDEVKEEVMESLKSESGQ